MADGKTYQEAVQNAEIIIQERIETDQKLGKTNPKTKRTFIICLVRSQRSVGALLNAPFCFKRIPSKKAQVIYFAFPS